ncbi:hypothetical protein HU200_060846 [Digitaria exilis]|uniref:Uncharacterized protein n=1 Tax=Digitaria exilis TaxID=1010633 RepID=A0A835A5U5_9POAL|nr:hypothetical protein HU200_060846 [Digitaria exilis]
MGGAEVRKSSPAVMIRPPEPLPMAVTTNGTIKLTSFDRGCVKVPVTVLLVFEHMGHEATDNIKRALSQALVHYYPFAGRIIISSSGGVDGDEFSIRCTGDGVEFLTASMDCSLKQAKILEESSCAKINPLRNELAILYPFGSFGSEDDPLLSVQVTEFSCGGHVLGVSWSHAIADAAGMAQFLAAVGELARGSPSPSVVPVRWDDVVSRLEPWPSPMLQAMLAFPETQGLELTANLDITIPSALIKCVKDDYLSCGGFDGQPCTVFEVVVAIVWRCHIRATMSNNNPGNPAYLSFASNMRKYVGSKDGYYGNCGADRLISGATRSSVAEAGFLDLIRMVKRAKDQLPDNGQLMQGLRDRYDLMHVTSWRNVGFEQVDLGGGAPAGVMFHGREGGTPPVPICIMHPACKGMDGVNLLLVTAKEHVDAFLGELAKHT